MLRLWWDSLLLERELLLSCKIIVKDRYIFDCIIDVIIYRSYTFPELYRCICIYCLYNRPPWEIQ